MLNLTTSTTSSSAKEPISIAIPFDLSREKGAMMQNENVSHGKTKLEERRELPSVPCSRPLYKGRIICGAVLVSMENKR
jgi:hypothetical protein